MLPAHLTIDILRPVPFAPTLAQSVVTRAGKSLYFASAELTTDAGVLMATAQGTFKRSRTLPEA